MSQPRESGHRPSSVRLSRRTGAWLMCALLSCSVVASLGLVDARGATHDVARPSASRAGALLPLPGTSGCLRPVGARGCAHARGIDLANDSAVSPDGRNIYVVSGFGSGPEDKAIAVFARDPVGGGLQQLPGADGCVSYKGRSGCAAGHGGQDSEAFLFLDSVDVSPDGRNVYVVGNFALLVFARNPDSGALTQLAESDGCMSAEARAGCAKVRGTSNGSAVRVSPDGRSVYVVASPYPGAVAVFTRDAATGALRQLPGRQGCISNRLETCEHARGMSNPRDIAVSPDGRSAYVASYLGTSGGSGTAFHRNTEDGTLRPLAGAAGCISWRRGRRCRHARGMREAAVVAVSPDGTNVYFGGQGVATFQRDGATGRLAQPRRRTACLVAKREPGCRTLSIDAEGVNISIGPNGRNLYLTAAFGNTITVLRRAANGSVSRLPGTAGCVAATQRPSCVRAPLGSDLGRLTVSPDGRHAYVSALTGGLTLFRRQP